VSELLAPLSHPDTKILDGDAASCWRFNGNCTTPVAAFGVREGESLGYGLLGRA